MSFERFPATLGPITIDWIGDRRADIATLAEWHVRAFGDYVNGWQIGQAAQELESHARRRGFPTTLVATHDDTLLGSVSLLPEDPPAPAKFAPFLATLFVRPEARQRGVGAALVRAAVAEASTLGIPELHLWTPDSAGFYLRLGWRKLGVHDFGGVRATVMRLGLREAE
jgi:GNAT superfamily N-acetyltransferase